MPVVLEGKFGDDPLLGVIKSFSSLSFEIKTYQSYQLNLECEEYVENKRNLSKAMSVILF